MQDCAAGDEVKVAECEDDVVDDGVTVDRTSREYYELS